jgi:hypothetical protein
MSTRSQFATLLAVTSLLWFPAVSWAQGPQVLGATTVPAPELPAALARVPAGKAVVTYMKGQLTIKARDARLIDVLREVCDQIGAQLDAHAAAEQPVLGVMGPGPAAEVLTSLLGHSQVDYALARSANDASVLALVAIYPKGTYADIARATGAEMAKAPDAAIAKAMDSDVVKATGSVAPTDTKQQLAELFGAAKAEIANSSASGGDSQGEEGRGADADAMASALSQIEAQINALADVNLTESANAPPQPSVAAPSAARHHRGRH